MLSARIKSAETAGELLDVVGRSVDEPVFNYIHAAAAYTRLGNLRKKGLLCAKEVDSDVLVRLGQRLQGMLLRREVGTLALANIFWAAASLFPDMPAVLAIVPAVAEQIPSRATDMVPQHLSNNLWAAAQLKDAVPDALKCVPALVEQIPLKAGDMTPQHLSTSLWALKDFPDALPTVAKAVQALVQEVEPQLGRMKPQELANTVEALILLGEPVPIANQSGIVAAAATQLRCTLPGLKDKDLVLNAPMVIWACRRFNVVDQRLFDAVVDRFSSHRLVASLPLWDLCALNLGSELVCLSMIEADEVDILTSCHTQFIKQPVKLRKWSYSTLNKPGKFGSFVDRLDSEIARRGLSGSENEVLAERKT